MWLDWRVSIDHRTMGSQHGWVGTDRTDHRTEGSQHGWVGGILWITGNGCTARLLWRGPIDHRPIESQHGRLGGTLQSPEPRHHSAVALGGTSNPRSPTRRSAARSRRCAAPGGHAVPLPLSTWGRPPFPPPTPPLFPIRSAAVSSASARAEVGISPITTGKEKRQKLKSQNNRFRGTGNRRGAERSGRSRLRATGKQTARRRTAAGPGGPNRSAGQNRTGAAGRPSGRESRAAARVVLGAAANRSLCGPKAIEKPPEGPKPH